MQMNYPIWHPVTQMKQLGVPPKVVRGEGSYLELEDGRRVIDGISSWWVNLHGHCHPKIVQAIHEQAQRLEHVIFAGFTHDPALELAQTLTSSLPGELNKVFFSDCGSTATEIALKLALQFWSNREEKGRRSFIAFEGGYHGDTFGAMAVASENVFNRPFKELCFRTDLVAYPSIEPGESILLKEQQTLDRIDELLRRSPQAYAAVIVEPLIQGAGGMKVARPIFFQRLEALVRSHGVLLIFDEVMTGFGRTGELFACLKAGVEPDLVALSKGISGGFLPLAATVCRDRIYEAFYSEEVGKGFYHSHSYMANPLACAAANASWELLVEDPQRFRGMEQRHLERCQELESHPYVRASRVCGTLAAFELESSAPSGYLNPIGPRLTQLLLDRGVFLRPMGEVAYLLPPYCITDEQLDQVYAALLESLTELFRS